MSAQYTFVSWFRQGMANFIEDTSGTGRPSISLKLKINTTETKEIEKEAFLYGPGDVQGINPQAIIRVEPSPGTSDFESNYLPFIEFYDEDLPWRYSPGKKGDQLSPWLALIVLKEEEFEYASDRTAPLPSIILSNSHLHLQADPKHNWAFAHVQVNGELSVPLDDTNKLSDALTEKLKTDPDVALSRIMCPRQLEPGVHYTAFLIPAFEAGRLAGLGDGGMENTGIVDTSWSEDTSKMRYPYYHHWSFSTDTQGDFETLVRKLEAGDSSELQVNTINIQDLVDEFFTIGDTKTEEIGITYGNPIDDKKRVKNPIVGSLYPNPILEIGSVLMPPGKALTHWPGMKKADKKLRDNLRDRINEGVGVLIEINNLNDIQEDPVINQPEIYGNMHANLTGPINGAATWLKKINLDPRQRVVAALGAEIVRQNQEVFMDYAWGQVGEVEAANQKIKRLQLAREVSGRMMEKHVQNRADDDLLTLTANLHSKLIKTPGNSDLNGNPKTLKKIVDQSELTKAGVEPGFKKILRPSGLLVKKLKQGASGSSTVTPLTGLINDLGTKGNEVTGASQKPNSYSITLNSNHSFNQSESSKVNKEKNFRKIIEQNVKGSIDDTRDSFVYPLQTEPSLVETIAPSQKIVSRGLRKIIGPVSGNTKLDLPDEANLKPIMAAPELPHPLYDYLKKMNPEFILPGVSGIPNNTVTLLEPNQEFIESLMLGANHELAKELLWREFPSDQSGTYFGQFWNKNDFQAAANVDANARDIELIHNWTGNLGTNRGAGINIGIVLILRGDLFRKYPNTIIYAQKCTLKADGTHQLLDYNNDDNVFFPVLNAKMEPDINIVGFDMTLDQVRGTGNTGEGCYFMFKERSSEIRFGLDEGPLSSVHSVAKWNDLTWGIAGPDYIDLSKPLTSSDANDVGITWNTNAAQTAHILYQAPVELGIHGSDLLSV